MKLRSFEGFIILWAIAHIIAMVKIVADDPCGLTDTQQCVAERAERNQKAGA